MPKLRNRIVRYLIVVNVLALILILLTALGTRTVASHHNIREDAQVVFRQIEQILDANEKELQELYDDYRVTFENKTRSAAYMIGRDAQAPEAQSSLKEIADLLEIDEINIFDENGVIIMSTQPKYVGFTMDDGEQIAFFKPLLKDRSLFLIQDVVPNSAEQRSMQYSAAWNEDGSYIVQIGMEPTHVLRVSEKNTLSHVFSLLHVGVGVELYAIDADSGVIDGASDTQAVGRIAAAIGIPDVEPDEELYASDAKVNGVDSYCIFTRIRGEKVVYAISRATVFDTIVRELILMGAAMLFITVVLVLAVMWYINRYVIRTIRRVNDSLTEITKGNLDAKVEEGSTAEFAQLCSHIKDMINSLLSTTDVMSYIINKTDLHIGVYVYNANMKYVRFTDYIPELLSLDSDEMAQMSSDCPQFKEYIRKLRSNPVPGENNIYRLTTAGISRYIRIEEAMHHHDVLGVVIDMTAEIEQHRRLESERDVDLLTGMLNRRGLKLTLNRLFKNPEQLGYGAIFMIDADDLKKVNDRYGHNQGDRYLKALADVLSRFGSKQNVSSRLGGDEFVVFLYGYENESDLQQDIRAFIKMQDLLSTMLGDENEVLVRFSMGYSLTYGADDPTPLLKAADEMMYENKRRRKGVDDEMRPLSL